ncbi:MAG: flagellar basal body rod protein FlgB, partial [Thalassobaculaceae bacterium]
NADTPHYRAKDLRALDFNEVMRARRMDRMSMARTDDKHLASEVTGSKYRVMRTSDSEIYEINPSGNAVILEEQMIKLSENNTQYQIAANIYQKQLTMLRLAVSGGGK